MEETFELPTLEALVFEYDPATRRALTSALLDYGFEVTATAESTEALDRLRLRAPHVVFVDFDAPTLGGSCFAVLVGETCAEVSVPIVATGATEPETLPPGTVAWLTKPAPFADIVVALRAAFVTEPVPLQRRRRASGPRDAPGRLTLYLDSGHQEVPIEACSEGGLRVLLEDGPLPLGERALGRIEWTDQQRGVPVSRLVRFELVVDSFNEASDGVHCGFRIASAKPAHHWKSYLRRASSAEA